MKTKTLMVALATLLTGALSFWACQKDEIVSTEQDTIEYIAQKAGQAHPDCHAYCIDPDDPVYYEMTQQEVITWGNPRNPHAKTVDIVYYNTLESFVLQVMSSEDIANLLVDGSSVKDFSKPIPAGEWYEITLPLPVEWDVCDEYAFAFSVIGNGPPAIFDVEYHLIGECMYYTLELVINPEGAGTVTGEGEYMEGEEVDLMATANNGYEFANWTDEHGDEVSGVAEFLYTMPAVDVMLTANFQAEEGPEPGPLTDIDGNVYQTVIIGNQEWMAENLRVTRYNNEDNIPTGLSDDDWGSTAEGAYAIYPHDLVDGVNSSEEMVYAYGKLYNWYAADDTRGLCPEGWHVPCDDDWTQLVDYLMDEYDYHNDMLSSDISGAGNALKSCRQDGSPLGGHCDTSMHPRWDSHGMHHGFDEFGFSALPGGFRCSSGNFYTVGSFGYWWSATVDSGSIAWLRDINRSRGNVNRRDDIKTNGFGIRCLRDID